MSLAIRRRSETSLILLYKNVATKNGDGSFSLNPKQESAKGFLTALTQDEIKRLKDGGITVSSGAVVSIPYELVSVPDEILYDGSRGRVVKYSIAEGVSVLILETSIVGYAEKI